MFIFIQKFGRCVNLFVCISQQDYFEEEDDDEEDDKDKVTQYVFLKIYNMSVFRLEYLDVLIWLKIF